MEKQMMMTVTGRGVGSDDEGNDPNLPQCSLVILEIGCGLNVPSVREECETVLVDVKAIIRDGAGSEANASATKAGEEVKPDYRNGKKKEQQQQQQCRAVLIRINPDHPDNSDPEHQNTTISIKSTALEALLEIDKSIGKIHI